jgi:acyl dehydratase
MTEQRPTTERPPEIYRGLTFSQQPVGTRWSTGRRTISETDLVTYATMFGFAEGLFLDATVSAKAGFTGRLVPGSLVMSVAEGLIVGGGSTKGTGIAYLGAEVQVKGPTYVGDTLEVWAEVTAARLTSRPDRGIVTTRNDVYNQHDEIVMIYTPTRMIRCEYAD